MLKHNLRVACQFNLGEAVGCVKRTITHSDAEKCGLIWHLGYMSVGHRPKIEEQLLVNLFGEKMG